jgi:hypothetical protein
MYKAGRQRVVRRFLGVVSAAIFVPLPRWRRTQSGSRVT